MCSFVGVSHYLDILVFEIVIFVMYNALLIVIYWLIKALSIVNGWNLKKYVTFGLKTLFRNCVNAVTNITIKSFFFINTIKANGKVF